MIEEQKLWLVADIKIPAAMKSVKKNVTKIVKEYAEDGVLSGEVKVDESGNLLSGIDLIEAAKQLQQEAILTTTVYEPKPHPTPEIIFIPLGQLQCHPINSSIYGLNEDLEDLKDSIKESGRVKVPLTVIPAKSSFFLEDSQSDGYVVLSGNRRLLAAKSLGLDGVNAQVVKFSSKSEELEELLGSNISREKSIEIKVRELQLWEQVESEKAKSRRLNPGAGIGSTRDLVAAKIGWSGVTYEHAKQAVQKMEETASADPDSADGKLHADLKLKLRNSKGVDAAYKLIKPPAVPAKETLAAVKPESSESNSLETPKFEIGDKVRLLRDIRNSRGNAYIALKGHIAEICGVRHETGRVMISLGGTGEPFEFTMALVEKVTEPEESPKLQEFSSVKDELTSKQQELGLGKNKLQVLPDADRNEGIDPESPVVRAIQASNNLDLVTAKLVKEILDLEDSQQVSLIKSLMNELVEGIFEAARKQYFEEKANEAA